MKYLILSIFIIFSLYAEGREKIVFGINPWSDEKRLLEMYKPFIDYIQKECHREIQFVVSKDYEDMKRLLQEGKVDFASLSPNLYVETKNVFPELIYIGTTTAYKSDGKNENSYKSVIITKKGTNIETLNDLKNRSFGFTDKQSTSGFLFPSYYLKKNGINIDDFKIHYFLKKHHKIVESLVSGSIDAGATYDDALENGIRKYGDIFKVLHISEPIPYDALVMLPNLDKKTATTIKKLTLQYQAENPKIFGEPINFKDIGDGAYDSIRAIKDK